MQRKSFVLLFLLWCALLALIAHVQGCGNAEPPPAEAEPPKPGDTPHLRHPPALLEIMITSGGRGQLEECKCQLRYANLVRRASILRAKQTRPILLIDAGSFLTQGGFTFTKLRQKYLMRAYDEVGYDVVVPARTELTLQKELLLDVIKGHEKLFVCANYVDTESGQPMFQPYKLVSLGGSTVGVIGVSEANRMAPAGTKLTDEIEAIRAVLPRVEAEADVIVVAGMLSAKLADSIARQFPQVALVITSSEARTAVAAQRTVGTAAVFDTGRIRSAVARLRLTFDPQTGQRTGLNHEILISDANTVIDHRVAKIVDDWRTEEFAQFTVPDSRPDPKGVSFLSTVRAANGWKNAYAGAAACGSCHVKEHDAWLQSAHAHAWQTLIDDNGNHNDVTCVGCHTVGFGQPDGFLHNRRKATAGLVNVGCESCHGRGGLHAAIMEGKVKPADVQGYELTADPKKTCITCHTPDNSPHFDFETYWKKIKH